MILLYRTTIGKCRLLNGPTSRDNDTDCGLPATVPPVTLPLIVSVPHWVVTNVEPTEDELTCTVTCAEVDIVPELAPEMEAPQFALLMLADQLNGVSPSLRSVTIRCKIDTPFP